MKPAIEIRNLGKEYKLAPSQPYVALRDILSNGAKNLFKARKEKETLIQEANSISRTFGKVFYKLNLPLQ